MFNVGAGEMMAILLVALVVLGPERLPKAMNQLGRYVGQLRQLSNGFQDELRRAIDVDNAPFRPGEESHPVPPVDEVKVLGSGPLPDDAQSTTGPVPPPGIERGNVAPTPSRAQIVLHDVPAYLWRHGCAPTAAGMVVFACAFVAWGLGAGIIYHRRGRLMPVIVAHFFTNLMFSVFPLIILVLDPF